MGYCLLSTSSPSIVEFIEHCFQFLTNTQEAGTLLAQFHK